MKGKIIAILAAPGVGKTFLANKLVKKLNGVLINEPPINDRVLENFKENKRQFETIIYFLNEGIKNIEKALKLKAEGKIVIMDSCWISTILHIKTMLKGFEKDIMLDQAKLFDNYLPKPDVLVYLTTSKKHIENNVLKRGREFDTSKEFLERIFSIKNEHEEYFSNSKYVVINRENLDFDKEDDLDLVINKITTK